MADDTSPSRGARSGLADALRRYADAVSGFGGVPRERAERIVSDLAKRGEMRTRDIQKAARELADRSARNQRELGRLIQKEVRRQVSALGLATKDEVARLQGRIRQLERKQSGAPEPSPSRGGTKRPKR